MIVTVMCYRCGATNRVAWDELQDGRCAGCGGALFDRRPAAMSDPSFRRYEAESDLPLLILFGAEWCDESRRGTLALMRAAAALEPFVRLATVDIETSPALARRCDIESVPTLILFHRGHELARTETIGSRGDVVAWTNAHLLPEEPAVAE
jgi:thioredoxin 2